MSKKIHQESGQDKITFRVPTHLKEQFKDESDTMSEELTAFVRRYVNRDDDMDGVKPWVDPDDRELAIAYQALIRTMSSTGKIRGDSAKKALASSVPHTDRQNAYRHLRRLEKRGYVKLQEEIQCRGGFYVNVRPFSIMESRGDLDE